MLEKMNDFFEARLDEYDQHMLNNIESATEFYPFTADALPSFAHARVLDLGCGTGLELEEYFLRCPSAKVSGIDLSSGMLAALKRKFSDKDITLTVGSYFDLPFGKEAFDAAVCSPNIAKNIVPTTGSIKKLTATISNAIAPT